ncbi:Gfo/Idh/MocA family protein [Actinophytocola sp. NPDC049390]|uniref:Gfo/Idh/MocA family protein n=1 Tax=Actinophytocola sp. NPDC049390 TaxID=3363894 RepID=UPI0037A20D66
MHLDQIIANTIPVIVGYGRAGRDLHRALRGLGRPEVVVADPRPAAAPGVTWLPTVAAALARVDPGRAVFHVATPVTEQHAVIGALVAAGARNVVLDKPAAGDVRAVAALAGRTRIVPVAGWLTSAVTGRVDEAVADGVIGAVRSIRMEWMEPRANRSADPAPATEVALPHQVLLALHLGGGPGEPADTLTWGMPLPDGTELPGAGGVDVTLRQPNRVTTRLMSDLTGPVGLRRLRVTGTRGTLVAHHPLGSDDHTGQVILPGHDRELIRDRPVTRFLTAAYAYFAGEGPPPPGDLALHVRVAELVQEATQHARTIDEEFAA